jgi:DNA modification methylase
MAGDKAAMVFSDPPYNVPIDGFVGGKGKIRHREFAMAAGELSPAEFQAFLGTVVGHMTAHSIDGALHYLCMDWRHAHELLAAAERSYSLKNLAVWVKDRAGMGSLYRSQHELIFVLKHGKGRHRNNVELGRHGRHRSNVWHYPSIVSDRKGEEGDLLALHPTVKPIRLVADAVLDASARGDVVLDPFLGSGTTLMACQRVGRHCRGMELDPRYVDVVIRRWQRDTGDAAIHAGSGQTFATRERKLRRTASTGKSSTSARG